MGVYPLDLILAVATASATICIGFLPTKKIGAEFFARQVLKAALAWAVVALLSPPAVMHFPFFFALICLGSWWQFNHENAFSGKMWLHFASGLGISTGVILILAVTPRAFPAGLPERGSAVLLGLDYLGGAIVGLAFVCHILTGQLAGSSGITLGLVRRHVGLLQVLVVGRGAVFLILLMAMAPKTGPIGDAERLFRYGHPFETVGKVAGMPVEVIFCLGLVLVVLPGLALYTGWATRFASRVVPVQALLALSLLGLVAEILRLLLT
jgi:hypothetical protein